jgi:hypothetical protein
MRRTFAAAAFLILPLIACAPQKQMTWIPDDPTKLGNFKKDRYECLQQASQATPPATGLGTDIFGDHYNYDINEGNRNKLMEACMNARGWTLQLVSTSASSPPLTDSNVQCGKTKTSAGR